MITYDPEQYKSPQRIWCPIKNEWLDEWKTIARFDVFLCDGTYIHVPKGFVYDKASIPRAVWWWLPRDDKKVIIASLVHDYLYETKLLTRKQSDQVFYQLLRESGMRWTKAQAAYRAVRIGGWLPWNT